MSFDLFSKLDEYVPEKEVLNLDISLNNINH